MSLRVLVALLLLIALVPVFGALALAWRELKSPSIQPRNAGERSRDDPRRRFVPSHVWRNVNRLAPEKWMKGPPLRRVRKTNPVG
jgi:hypothetical protein